MIPRSLSLEMWDEVLSDLEITRVREPIRIPEHDPDFFSVQDVSRYPGDPRYRFPKEDLVEFVNPSMVFSGSLSGFSEKVEIAVKMPRKSLEDLHGALTNPEAEYFESPFRHAGDVQLRADVVYDKDCNPYLSIRITSRAGSTRTIHRVKRKATPEETLSSVPAPHAGTLYLVSFVVDPLRRPNRGRRLTPADYTAMFKTALSRVERGKP